jgi:Ca2+-binding EF-hand superfamily protein
MISGMNGSIHLPGAVDAASMTQRREAMFKKLDTDGSGTISKAEMQTGMSQTRSKDGDTIDISEFFAKIDTDNNGEITSAEAEAFDNKMAEEMSQNRQNRFSQMDTDGNGSISKDELKTMLESMPDNGQEKPDVDKLFAEIDADSSGEISKAESDAFEEKMASKGPQGKPPAGGPPPGGMPPQNSTSSTNDTSETKSAIETYLESLKEDAETKKQLLYQSNGTVLQNYQTSTIQYFC